MARNYPKKKSKSPGKGSVLKFANGGFVPSPGGRPASQAYFTDGPNDVMPEDAMRSARARMDMDESAAKTRFWDGGTRIPGPQKARNDKWEADRKKRRGE